MLRKHLPILIAAAALMTVQVHAQPLEDRVERTRVMAEYTLESGHLWKAVAAKDRFVELYAREDSNIALVRDLAGHQLHRYSKASREYDGMVVPEMSEDGSALILSYAIGIESFRHDVINSDGVALFSDRAGCSLDPSHSGRYFLRQWNEINGGWLTILDRSGAQVVCLPIESYDARFVGDTLAFYADPDSAGLIDVVAGRVLWSRTHLLGGYTQTTPTVCVSNSKSPVAAFRDNDLVLYSPDGTERWRQSFSEPIFAAAIDPILPWMVLLLSNPHDSVGYLRVISLSDPDVSVSTTKLESLLGVATRQFEYLWMENGFIWLLSPRCDLWFYHEGEKTETLFAEFDAGRPSLSEPVVSSGFYYRIERIDSTITFLRAQPGHPAQLVSIKVGNSE